MSRKTYVEITCDNCGLADFAVPGNVDAQVRSVGSIVTRDRKDFCNKKCRDEFRQKNGK